MRPVTDFSKSFKTLLGILCCATALVPGNVDAEAFWNRQESEHFVVIYRNPHGYLAPHILSSAEKVLARLSELLDYLPTEKIHVIVDDFSDSGSAAATSVPHNTIRLQIEPLELDYESLLFNERIQWLLGHELVHVAVGDKAGKAESVSRSLFSKVPPEQSQPLTTFYSLMTNSERYTPLWHQEGIAVFLETWLSGGYGRTLGSFDEMYFQSLVLEGKPFPAASILETREAQVSFLVSTLHYIYGGRFVSYLAATYGADRVLAWYSVKPGRLYYDFESKFEKTFGIDIETAWKEFGEIERRFQGENIGRLTSSDLTPVKPLLDESLGWVTRPYVDSSGSKIIFGQHQSHDLTSIQVLDIESRTTKSVGSLPSPSMTQIASTAYDSELGLFFFTTNNNELFRDIHVLSLDSGESKLLFEDVRVGQITVSPTTHELWGIRHSEGLATLVYSAYPYRALEVVVGFDFGDVLYHLAVSPSGRYLAATLHRPSGDQSIIVADLELMKRGGNFSYQFVSNEGSPEFPAWSPDENQLFWNANTNGVSNIYRYDRTSGEVHALTHTLRGLFKAAYVSPESLVAFEFTTDGFTPVLVPNELADRLPAIEYYGQKIVERSPDVAQWSVAENLKDHSTSPVEKYSGLSRLQIHSLIPVVSGFQDRVVVGLFSHLADPLYTHDFTFEAGVSPFNRNTSGPSFHFKGRYEYKRTYRVELDHNAPSFYDLFNPRKSGMNGTKLGLGHTHYWKFDNPHKIEQKTDLAFYTGVTSINDNLVPISTPNFVSLETSLHSNHVRRAIGSADTEHGNDWTMTLMALGLRNQDLQVVGGLHGEWNHYRTWGWHHNVLHTQVAAGYLHTEEGLGLGQFYFGGFGNQYLEDKPVKQYRDSFRFPGIPIHSVSVDRFAKVMVEHNLPPWRFRNLSVGRHYLSHIDATWFTQGLFAGSPRGSLWWNWGAQINLVFKHWSNLETTLSAGLAQAWHRAGTSRSWFLSFKLLKN